MHIELIGTGAIGLLYGSKLKLAQSTLHAWCRTEEQLQLFADIGVELYDQSSREIIRMRDQAHLWVESHIDDYQPMMNSEKVFIIIAVKQTNLDDSFMEKLGLLLVKFVRPVIVAFQNGIGHVDKLKDRFPSTSILTVVTSEGSRREAPNVVTHTGRGVTNIGYENEVETSKEDQKIFTELLEKAGFQVNMSKNIKDQVFQKLLINAVINPLTAIFQVKNGQLPKQPYRRKIMEALFEESKQIVIDKNPNLHNFSFEQIVKVCDATAENLSSMLVDVQSGRETEIMSINGALVDFALENNKSAPLNTAVVQFVKALHP